MKSPDTAVISLPSVPDLEETVDTFLGILDKIDLSSISEEAKAGIKKLQAQEINTREELVYGALTLANAISKKVSSTIFKLVYSEERILAFIDFCEQEKWLPREVADTCRDDLAKESVQEILSLQVEIECTALPIAGVLASNEIINGSHAWENWLQLYAIDSSLRFVLSYLLSHNVVQHRFRYAGGEARPHIGRFTSVQIIAQEHPELARLLHAYNRYRKVPEKQYKPDFDMATAQEKFNRRYYSDAIDRPLRSIVQAGASSLNNWANKNPVAEFSLKFGQAIGL